jgi:cell division protein FtsL
MRGVGGWLRWTLALSCLLTALVLVTWRQSRALEVLARLDGLRTDVSLVEAEIVELERSIQLLESRLRVVPAAQAQLGMRLPAATEQVILSGEPQP